MFRKRENYLEHLLVKIDDFRNLMKYFKGTLEEVKNYYDITCNHNSATDSRTLMTLNNLYDKAKYTYMYLDVLFDFYQTKKSDSE